jgi:hypothetical protein
VPGVDGALLLAYTGSVQEKMRPLRVLLLGACVYLALLGPVGAKKKSKRAARLAAKKAAADSFHGSAGAAPWQMEASYMPEDFSGGMAWCLVCELFRWRRHQDREFRDGRGG